VHAVKFFAHFDHDELAGIPLLVHRLNCILPPSIAVHSIFPVDDTAHARFSAISRTYLYRMYFSKNPFLNGRAWYTPHRPDIMTMNRIAGRLLGHSDFSCFSKSRTQTRTSNCLITAAGWKESGEELQFTITADRFLRNMVRAIVGTLVESGFNKISEEEFMEILESGDRSEAGMSVPAHGLYLADIRYPFEIK
jgi:tRNA pseudouridine38-40 synthase